ncbi:hypothetical protein [Paenibacillus mucilaginosus]|uniref:Uncharacterized protein n=3 Tax=Paenibacillus mucilaginosus TaxID=61624 RepID=H6NF93_9BACL|nr:hypothetical protein [Paenibacillus mucilaginosus]AEI40917.1 hypothetical protein KNP414_02356 [Paenibacillus mucilaginosus KNP414]AFC29502.1 hypothetical protein PM3016_2620 [Paenibacillus mucilaginosus 3016]AFH61680.1 hypothetical protein B2K_13290 [Paenibacillus mucilaginosus K02]MCG7211626.1 hypothetical protein [Paenibacillus mucilaginosus]WDM30014.1 hypothetical protein KCX80_13065 [Paenibacillus mucilaginosus]
MDDALPPRALVHHLLSVIEDDDTVESIVYVARMKDGTIVSGWSDLLHTEVIGLLEVGKLQAVKEMWEDWQPR